MGGTDGVSGTEEVEGLHNNYKCMITNWFILVVSSVKHGLKLMLVVDIPDTFDEMLMDVVPMQNSLAGTSCFSRNGTPSKVHNFI